MNRPMLYSKEEKKLLCDYAMCTWGILSLHANQTKTKSKENFRQVSPQTMPSPAPIRPSLETQHRNQSTNAPKIKL